MRVVPVLRPLASYLSVGALLLLPGIAAAAQWEIYGGLGIGYSGIQLDQDPFEPISPDPEAPPVSLSRDLEGSAFAIQPVIGARFGKYVGLEANYFHYDTFKDDTFPPAPDFPVIPPYPVVTHSTDIEGYSLYLLGYYAVNQTLDLFGKAGVVSWDSEQQIRLGSEIQRSEADGEDLALGVGLDYLGTGNWKGRLEFQFLDMGDARNWNVMASVIYRVRLGR